jgi:hypothetical protein
MNEPRHLTPLAIPSSGRCDALPGGAVRWFVTRPLRPAGPGYGNNMDDTAERHYTEECQQTYKAQAAA